MNNRPLFSVITPSFNRVFHIRTAIESVLAQHYEPFEHIIMDGGSTDGTLELLKSYPHLRVVSEPDRGLYDALNKGISLARGEIIAQLNTDDNFEPGIFPAIAEMFAKNPEAEAISGEARIFKRQPAGDQTIIKYGAVTEDELPYRATIGVAVFNAWFFRKAIFELIGPYSLEYPVAADYDFLIRCYLAKIKIIPFHAVVYHYLQHSGSLTVRSPDNSWPSYLNEKFRLAEKYMHSRAADPVIKKYFTEWHDLTSIELLITLVRQRKPYSALKVLWRASRHNPKWPFLVISQSPLRIRNYIRKRYAAHR